MLSTKFSIDFINTSALLNFIINKFKAKKQKIYDYTNQVSGQDYVFEKTDENTKGYMTGQRKGVLVGDIITLKHGAEIYHYQVEQIEYYSNPSDMWTAVLKLI